MRPGAASVTLHVTLVIAAAFILLPHFAARKSPGAVEVIFVQAPPASLMLGQVAIAEPPGETLVDALRQTFQSIRLSAPAERQMPAGSRPARGRRTPAAPAAVPASSQPSGSPTPTPIAERPVPANQASAATTDLLGPLEIQIRRAVQEAVIYPASARMQHREGRAQIGFAFRSGMVSNVALIVSSGSRLIDHAALAAVQRAAMPRAPAPIANTMLKLSVWVQFSLASDG